MANATINISGYQDIVNRLNAIKRSQLKFIVSKSLNELGYWLKQNEAEEMKATFNSLSAFTKRAPLYTKSTKENLQITFFLRDTAGKGTPPSVYLEPQVSGSEVYVTGFTRKLRRSGLISDPQYAAHWASKTGQKLTGGRLNQILFGLGASGPTLRKQGPRTAKQAGMYFIEDRSKPNAATIIKGRKYKPKRERGYIGPGIYTRKSGQLEQLIPIYPKPLTVPAKYDWKAQRIQGLADKQFTVFMEANLAKI